MADSIVKVEQKLHPRFMQRDWNGFRSGKGHVFTCRCGCGGHVLISPGNVALAMAVYERETARVVREQRRPHKDDRKVVRLAAEGYYIDGHEPDGILKARTGERTQLRGTA